MARQTRQQRRERRAQQEPALAGAGRPPAPPPPTANGGAQPAPRPAPRPTSGERKLPFFGTLIHFVQESVAELKKVEWPSQKQVIAGTTVVLIACMVVGAFLYANDLVWKHVVHWLINL